MNYQLFIEGGFMGISQEYKGEVTLGEVSKDILVQTMKGPMKRSNTKLRDGLKYKLVLLDGDRTYEREYDESNLPEPVRVFIKSELNKKLGKR
ncbi:MAG: hypothetical protein WBG90_14025 [Saonia sp.]